MSNQPKVLVVSEYQSRGVSPYYRPFRQFGEYTDDVKILDKSPKDVVLVVFTGGSDVSPELYGELPHPTTYCNKKRDQFENKVFDKALKLKLNITGICRGAQFICAKSGGKLVQHMNNHNSTRHSVTTEDGRVIQFTSSHHQMQLPNDKAVPIAWADPKLSSFYRGAPGVEYKPDLEHDVVWYPQTNAIGMQYHPEYMRDNEEGFKYPHELVERFFGLESFEAEEEADLVG